jgi:hypothetical protein
MNVDLVEQAIVSLLDGQETFRVDGYDSVIVSADEITGNNRLVQIFYSDSAFLEGESAVGGEYVNQATFTIRFLVAANTQVDKTVFENEESTEEERRTAISNLEKASKLAHVSIKDLWDKVFTILTDNRNFNLGIAESTLIVSDPWISKFEKNRPISDGEYIVVTGVCELTCKFLESVIGEAPVPMEIIDTEIIFNEDTAKVGHRHES